MALEAQKSKLTGKLTDLQKDLGFAKFVAGPSREPVIQGNRVFVYTEGSGSVIKSTLDTIIEQTDALYKRPSGVSSKGTAVWMEGEYAGLELAVKPYKDKSLNTDEQETLQGIYIATKFNNPSTNYSIEDLRRYGDPKVMSKYKIDDLFMKANKMWTDSSMRVGDFAYSLGKIKGDFIVHQRSNSKFVTNISKAANMLIREAGYKMGLDKWNPADIWLVNPALQNTDFTKFRGIVELNKWILNRFNEGKLIPVSLKMTGKNVKLDIKNPNTIDKMFDYQSYDVGKKGYVEALNGTIFWDGGSMIIRNFGRPESVAGEINGKFAQGGKVKGGIILDAINRVGGRVNTKTHQEILKMYDQMPMVLYKKLFQDMAKLDSSTFNRYDLDKFMSEVEVKANKLNYLISKYQVGDIMQAFLKLNKEQKNKVILAAVGYAGSETDVSSVHIKIY
jgi:hypothetical protein|tara:strand:- start:39 stop:1379 length:1341 start_codon:yes stop_codon:yes gene_type:complete